MNTKVKTPILLIEDNPGDAHLIALYLNDSSVKHELYHTETLFEGINLIKDREINLVLLDLSLPDSNGFKTLSNFLERVKNIPVIVLTGTNNEIIGNQAIKAGAQEFLVKGQFDGKLLGRAIRYSIQRYKTQLKLEETAQRLVLSEKRFVEAQEMAHFGNWEMDIVTNEMQWTDEVYRIFGFPIGSIKPSFSDYLSYVHMEDKESVEAFFESVAKVGKEQKLEHRIVIEGRTIKYVAIQAKVFYEDLTGKLILVGGIQDITERKQAEQLIIEKNISQSTSKLKEDALDDMSFQIRTPLSSIVNLLFLLNNTHISPSQKELIEGLKISVDDLSISLNNLLNFSVLASENIKVEMDEFKIHDFLQSNRKIVQIKADNANIELDFQVDSEIPETLISDSKKITQILFNLVDNAIYHSDKGEKVIIRATQQLNEDKGIQLCLQVETDGQHLDTDKIKKMLASESLLETYREEDEDPNKQELGMAIVAKLSKILDASLNIKNNEDAGFCFQVLIPVKAAKNLTLMEGEEPDSPIRILLVEDHFLNQIATKKVLTTWSEFVTVDIAENGLVGVEKFREHGYDLILMDLQMPVMTGIEAAQKIREQNKTPIIALTANASRQEMEKCIEVGMDDYLAKPFKPQELYAKIMNLLVTVEA